VISSLNSLTVLLRAFKEGRLTAQEFADVYFDVFRKSSLPTEKYYDVLNQVFYVALDYCEGSAGSGVRLVGEDHLKAAVRVALQRLQDLSASD
jgi:hypothetical protein